MTIAEIGQAHEGSLGIAHSYIEALKKTGVDAVKFQTHIAEAESSVYEPFRVKFSYEDDTRYDYWKRMEFTEEQWIGLKNRCDDVGLEFISSPFSNAAVDLLERLGVKRYKIGSGEVSNHLMLEKIAATGKEVILSSGMSNWKELDSAVNIFKQSGNPLSILQCTTSYPTEPEQWGLNVLEELKNRYEVPVGFSDHSGDIYACLAATSLGAEILEFHVVFDKGMFGPDAKSSLTLSQITMLCQGVRDIRRAQSHPIDKNDIEKFGGLKNIFEKSLALNKALAAGSRITMADLEAKKPSNQGIPANVYEDILNKELRHAKEAWDFLQYEDLI
jgi:N,N'-diacetyllegionaminate synthase